MPPLFGVVKDTMPSKLNTLASGCLIAALALALPAAAQNRLAPPPEGCGEIVNTYGPFDYRTAHPQQKSIVERVHFTRGVETLTKRGTGDYGFDIGYTLAVFPNHSRAMLTLENLVAMEKSDPPHRVDMTIECYYARGMAFAPDDLVFRMFYVSYLIRKNRPEEARRFLDHVVTQAGDNALTHFNAGLLFFDMKDYDQALAQAHRAMAMGMARTDLRDRLTSVGRWKEPAPEGAASAASAP